RARPAAEACARCWRNHLPPPRSRPSRGSSVILAFMGVRECDASDTSRSQNRGGPCHASNHGAPMALVLTALLAGCTAGFGDSTALENPEGSGDVCVPADSHGRATLGLHQLVNTSEEPVHITDVS